MNKKAREKSAKAKEQVDLETLQKMNEASFYLAFTRIFGFISYKVVYILYLGMQNESNTGVDGDKEKYDGRGKSIKVVRIISLAPSYIQMS